MKKVLTLLFIVCSISAQANFGGFIRKGTNGAATILSTPESQYIELTRENINISLDQRIYFTATFYLKNTSNNSQTLTLAFPQSSYWKVPYDRKKRSYFPTDYVALKETLTINGKGETFDNVLYSSEYNHSEKYILKDRSEFTKELIEYAGWNEAENPPTMPFILWKLKDVIFKPNETKIVEIVFRRPWFFEDEIWSTGNKTDGVRFFEYIFETAKTWKGEKIGEFNMSIKFPQDAWDQLNLDNDWFEKVSDNEVVVNKNNWAPAASENLKLIWTSKYQIEANSSDCYQTMYFDDYSWRFASDGSLSTSWCYKTENINCGRLEIIPIDPKQIKNDNGRFPQVHTKTRIKDRPLTLNIINGFAKSDKLARQNAKPRKIKIHFKGVDSKDYSYIIELENHSDVQSFQFRQQMYLSAGFWIEFLDYYPGTKYNDVCLAEIWFE